MWRKTLKYADIQSPREAIESALHQCRQLTLDLWADMDRDTFYQQAHPDFSPVGWHFGHIAFTEAYWILEQLAGYKPLWTEYKTFFAADGLPKQKRQHLPPRETIEDYLHTVRSKVLNYLATAPIQKQARLWYWLIQHESQHSETISFLLQLQGKKSPCYPRSSTFISDSEMVKIPGGEFLMGSNAIDTQDNERPEHSVYLDTYWIDTYPVTCGEYGEFIAAGGYQKREFWSEVGWEWLQLRPNPVNQPLYSSDPNHPVCGVSWYEAEAYTRFVGKELPTEAEWEKAASWDEAKGEKLLYPWGNTGSYCNCNGLVGKTTPVNAYPQGKSPAGCYDMLGNVWEWTNSWFDGYEGFESYPYPGYSQAYFDRQHRVLRGGSWATRSWGLRCSFRNWYHPWVRQIFAGFRCGNH